MTTSPLKALTAAKDFIALEYADAACEHYGEWLAPEAREVFGLICEALASAQRVDAPLAATVGEPCGYLYRQKGTDERWQFTPGEWPKHWGEQGATYETKPLYDAPAPSQPDGEIERLTAALGENAAMNRVTLARAEAAESRAEALRADGQFLLDRLNDFIADADDMPSMTRNWFGHVEPAMGRFRVSLLNGEKGRG